MRAIICPPASRWTSNPPEQGHERFKRLLNFLEKSELMQRCEFVVSTEKGPNCLFLGRDLLFEGLKAGAESGYNHTIVSTDKEYVAKRLKDFDGLFRLLRSDTLATYGDKGRRRDGRGALRKAVVRAVQDRMSTARYYISPV